MTTDNEEEQLRSAALQNARDILAARRRAEEELVRSKQALEQKSAELACSLAMLRATLESTADGIVVTDAAGMVTDHNEKYSSMWGIAPELMASRDHYRMVQAMSPQLADPQEFLRRVQEIRSCGQSESFDVLKLADGRVFERYSKLQQLGAEPVGRVWSFRDVTRNVVAERQLQNLNDTLEQEVAARTEDLRSSQRQFEQLVAGVTDCAIYMLDSRGFIASWNLGAERIKGYVADEIIGHHVSHFYTAEDRAKAVPDAVLATAASKGKFEGEGWRVRKDGTRFWAAVLVDAIYDPAGSLVGYAKITRDMTELRMMQEQLHQSQKMEAIGQLTGGVAHDFNNLLTVILGNLETIWREVPTQDGRLRRAVDQATRGAQRAATLTQQLLAFSRRQPLNPKPTDVNRLVSGLSDLIRRTLCEDISIETVLGGGLWRIEVDAHQLESALLNLAVNARDAMPEGGKLTIETANTHLDERYSARYVEITPGQYVVICITDTGCGMSSEVLARAFDPFFTTKPIGQGTGLGLSQVFGFVKQSGGHVKLYSEVGEGTTVKIYLPRFMSDQAPVEPEPPPTVLHGDSSEIILVVEDDDDVRIYSTESLRELGFSVLEAHDGASALLVLERHPEIKLLFTDVGLPGINGRELVERARQLRPRLKVLFTTGYARNAIMHQGRLDTGVELLTKPFTRGQLAERVRRVLDAKMDPLPGQRIALIVEDEPLVRMFLVEKLEQLGFEVAQAFSAREGIAAAERLSSIEVAVVDIGLPDRSGLELAADIRTRWPQTSIVVASGYGDQRDADLQRDRQIAWLQKPYDAAAIRAAFETLGIRLQPSAQP